MNKQEALAASRTLTVGGLESERLKVNDRSHYKRTNQKFGT